MTVYVAIKPRRCNKTFYICQDKNAAILKNLIQLLDIPHLKAQIFFLNTQMFNSDTMYLLLDKEGLNKRSLEICGSLEVCI